MRRPANLIGAVILLTLAAGLCLTGPLRAEDAKATGPLDQGQRVFTAGHSFHVFLPNLLKDLAQSAGVKGHEQVGVQSLGGSRVLQHWDLPDDKNKAKEALRTGKVDVLTLSPIFHPDEGIDHFTKLALAHNPAVRVTIQASWLPYDTYAPDYQLQFGHSVATVETGTRLCGDDGRPVSLPCCCSPSRGGVEGPPVGQAVIALREKIIAGEAPGLKTQEDLFSDAIGHARPPLQALAAYCHFAVIYRRSPVGLPVPAVICRSLRRSGTKFLQCLLSCPAGFRTRCWVLENCLDLWHSLFGGRPHIQNGPDGSDLHPFGLIFVLNVADVECL